MAKDVITIRTVTVEVWDRVQQRNVPLDIELAIDMNRLAERLGAKAFANSSKLSRLVDGMIVARVK